MGRGAPPPSGVPKGLCAPVTIEEMGRGVPPSGASKACARRYAASLRVLESGVPDRLDAPPASYLGIQLSDADCWMLCTSRLFTPRMRDMGGRPPARAARTRPIIVLDEGGQGGRPARFAAPRPGVLPFLGLRAPIHSVLGEIRVRVSQMRRLCNEKRARPSRDGFRLNSTCRNDAKIGALHHPSGFSLHNRRFSGKPDAFRRKMQPRSGPSRATRSDPARRRTAREGAGGAPRACCGTCWLA